jgi:hypothetical protein
MLIASSLLLVLLSCFAEGQDASRGRGSREVAALVSAVSGTVSIELPRKAPLSLFDWVRDGEVVLLAKEATATLVLTNGTRFELTGPARATVGRTGLSAISGSVRALSPLPRLPRVPPIAAHEQPGRHGAAVRVRGPRIGNLYPSDGAVAPAATTSLMFDPVEGGARYAVEIEDSSGTRVYQIETTETRVAVPPVLKPGESYYWRVRTVGKIGAQARGETAFTTLTTADEAARRALHEALGPSRDPHALGFLAHIDYRLGLLREAHEGVRAALDQGPGDPNLRAALTQLAQRLQIP